jgi:hypothetical protein
MNRTRSEKCAFALVTPDPPFGFENFERPPQSASADADLRGQYPLGRKSLVRAEWTLVEEGPQLPKGEVRAIRQGRSIRHSKMACDPMRLLVR